MSALPLKRIEGKYEILEKLGEGGMGSVYKVRHLLLDEIRVIKVMRSQLMQEEDLKSRFFREARLASNLKHPNIAQLYDFDFDNEDGIGFIILEYVPGLTLEEILRGGPPSLDLTLEIGRQALQALAFLHSKKFVHRDISPDNLMLSDDGGEPVVKMIDLGIAKTLEGNAEHGPNLTQTGTFLGKVRYSPPEQFGAEGASTIDARGDLYSFGIVFYELLTGRYPIRGRDSYSIMAGHMFHEPISFAETDPEGQIPQGLRDLVLRMLAKTPADRPGSARQAAAELARFQTYGEISAEELKTVLSRSRQKTVRLPVQAPPGSTQARLDRHFLPESTPSPARRLAELDGKTELGSKDSFRATLSTIGMQIESGDLLTAEAELRWAVETYGQRPELETLRDRLRECRLRELEHRLQSTLEEVRSRLAAGDLDAAFERLQGARSLAPGNLDVLALQAELEDRRQDRARERRRGAAEEEQQPEVAEIEAALERKQYRAAEMLLYAAEARHGESEAFSRLHHRLVELRRQDLEAREAARRRAERLTEALREIEARLERGELEPAGRLLEEAGAEHGEEAFARLRSWRDDLLRRERQAGAAAALEQARQLFQSGELEPARRKATEAAELDPETAGLKALEAEIAAEEARLAEVARRSAALAAAVEAIGARLDARAPDEAARLLDAAAAEHGDPPVLQDLARRLESLRQTIREERERREEEERQAARKAELAAALDEARQQLKQGKLDEALARLEPVARLDPENAEAAALRQEVEVERRRREEEAAAAEAVRLTEERARQLAAAVRGVEERLQQGDLDAAAQALATAQAEFGEADPLPALAARLVELRRQAEELKRQAEERRRGEELAAAIAAIDAALGAGDPDGASRLLPAAVASFGDVEPLRERWSRIEDLRLLRRTQDKAEGLLAKARRLAAAGQLGGAQEVAREAALLRSEHAETRALLQELEEQGRRQAQEARLQQEIDAALATIDACLDRRDLEGAAQHLPPAISRFGGLEALRGRWERLEKLRRQAGAETLVREAAALAAAGAGERAAFKLRRALELDPENREAQDRLRSFPRS